MSGKNKGKKSYDIKNPWEVTKPNIKISSSSIKGNIIVSSEEAKAEVEEAIAKIDTWILEEQTKLQTYIDSKQTEADKIVSDAQEAYNKKIKDADSYYEKKQNEADKLVEGAEDRIKKEVDDLLKIQAEEYENEFKQRKTDLESNLNGLIADNKALLKTNEEKNEELSKSINKYNLLISEIETSKINMRAELEAEYSDKIKTIIADRDNYRLEHIKTVAEKDNLQKKYNNLKSEYDVYEESIAELNNVQRKNVELDLQNKQLISNFSALEKINKELVEKNSELLGQLRRLGNDPDALYKQLEEAIKQRDEARNLLSRTVAPDEILRLQKIEEEYNFKQIEFAKLMQEKVEIEKEKNNLSALHSDLSESRRYIKILSQQKAELEQELDRTFDLYNKKNFSIFPELKAIDKEEVVDVEPNDITLEDLCNQFKGYMFNQPLEEDRLYFKNYVIRTFVAGLAASRIFILEGLSGTGKSSLPRAFMRFINNEQDRFKALEIPVQSSWKDKQDLVGFYNDFKKQYKETDFLKAAYQAAHNPKVNFIIVLDEMNLSRVEYYFAEVLSKWQGKTTNWTLDLIPDAKSLTQNSEAWPELVHSNEGILRLYENLWFVGTANNDDSTQMISDKVYDRSIVLDFEKKFDKQEIIDSEGPVDRKRTPIMLGNISLREKFDSAVRLFPKDLNEKYLKIVQDLDKFIIDKFDITFGNRIQEQLKRFVPVYYACGGTIDEAIDVIFAFKVLRKLKGRFGDATLNGLNELENKIISDYPSLEISSEVIDRLKKEMM